MTDKRPESAIFRPKSWTSRLSLENMFSVSQPLDVEIGCGKGRFLTALARKNPGRNFLGVDRLLARLRKVDGKISREGLTNVRLLRIEAAYAVEFLLQEASVTTFYILFPDPWPKRRHHRRRLFEPVFMDSLHKTLVDGGCVYVTTDHLDYFERIHKLFTADSRFGEVPPFLPSEDERSEFETMFLRQNRPIGRCGFRKTGS